MDCPLVPRGGLEETRALGFTDSGPDPLFSSSDGLGPGSAAGLE